MSSPDNAEVIQGRLGWEPGDVSEADPSNLEPHPKNKDIYGDTDSPDELDDTFLQSVGEKGVLEPLVITDGKKIISGHRRWLAARAADLDRVPVRYTEFDSDLAEREALVEFNRQREKTPGQIVNEFEEVLDIEQDRAEERQKEIGRNQGQDPSGNVSERGEARDKAAEKVNADVSGRTIEKGKKVKDKATDESEPEEVRETAREQWEKLQSGDESFNGAYQEVKTAENRVEKKQRREENREQFKQAVAESEAVEIEHGDFGDIINDVEPESFDHIVTDPPYDADAVELWDELGRQADRVLKPGGLLVAYSGTLHLNDVYDVLDDHLEYYWQCIVSHTGPGSRVWPRNLRTNYKPIIVYAKPPVEKLPSLAHDVISGDGMEKDEHEWQQAEQEAVDLLEQFTEPNDRILDPMCGSGTTGVAALQTERRVMLVDQDKEAIESARKRVNDVL
jgi:16S rRNA G966 N2-methylase RsmD